MSPRCCLCLVSWGRAYRKMNYTTQRTGWMFCSQREAKLANLPRQDLAGASNYPYSCRDGLPPSFNCSVFLLPPQHLNYLSPLEVCEVIWHVKLALIGMKAQKSIPTNHHYSFSKLCGSVSAHPVNPLESLQSFIDWSERLRKECIGQAAVVHAAESLELPAGTVRRSQLYCTCLFVWAELRALSPRMPRLSPQLWQMLLTIRMNDRS